MNVSCPACKKVYSLPDEALAGGAQMRIRCKACQTMIDVKSGGAVTAVWYAMLAGAQAGPFDVEQLKAKIAAQELDAQTLVWKQGLAEWKAAAQVDEVKALLPAVAASGLGDALFDDVHDHAPSQGELKLSDHDEKKKAEEATEEAALKALAPTDPAKPPGEVTKYFINQSGANKRNPPWKIALFGMAFIGGPVAVLYLLATFRIVPMEVTHTNENGEVVTESFFSSGGVSGVADFLSGKEAKRKAERDAKVVREAQARRQREKDLIAQAQTGGTNLDLDSRKGSQTGTAAMGDPTLPGTSIGLDIGQAGKKTFEPKLRGMGTTPAPAQGSGGLDDAAAAKVVAQSQNAFQGCIENALRRNPNMKVGKVEMTVTVGHSGSVLRSAIAPKQHDTAEWGVCLKERAKRMVFPPFEGDDEADVKVPLVVGVSAL